ncbi:MAG: dienelactone hydrolase family protein [Acidimicrobiales bacterium]
MPSERLSIQTADGPMPAYQSLPDGRARGAVVVVQEAFGVTAHIERVAERLAAAGWAAVAPALFHRQGSPVFAYGDISAVMPAMRQLTSDGIAVDVAATCEHLAGAGFSAPSQAIVGFCMGGTVAFYAAVDRRIGAAVTFYGGGIADGRFGYKPQPDVAGGLQTPWLGLYGDLDQSIPPDQVEALREAASASAVATDVVRYPGAHHGFNCDDRPDVYDASVAGDAWSRMLAWFEANVAA